eukprot:271855_1
MLFVFLNGLSVSPHDERIYYRHYSDTELNDMFVKSDHMAAQKLSKKPHQLGIPPALEAEIPAFVPTPIAVPPLPNIGRQLPLLDSHLGVMRQPTPVAVPPLPNIGRQLPLLDSHLGVMRQPKNLCLQTQQANPFRNLIQNNIDLGYDYSNFPKKYSIQFKKGNNLSFVIKKQWINKSMAPDLANHDIQIDVPMLPLTAHVMYLDFDKEIHKIQSLIPRGFDVPTEQTSNIWYLASLQDQDALYTQTSMQLIARGALSVKRCTGTNTCTVKRCFPPLSTIKRTKRNSIKRTKTAQVTYPACKWCHQPQTPTKCDFLMISGDLPSITRDRTLCRFVIRVNLHTSKCHAKTRSAKPSAEAFYHRSQHAQDRATTEAISTRFHVQPTTKKPFQLGDIDPYLTQPNNVKVLQRKHRRQMKERDGVKGNGFAFLRNGVPKIF